MRSDGSSKVNYISDFNAYCVLFTNLRFFAGADDKTAVKQDVAIAFLVTNALA